MKRLAESIRWSLAIPLLLASACTGEFTVDGPPFGGEGGNGGADAGIAGGGGGGVGGEAFFQQNILPLMSSPRPKGACALCHQGANAADGPDFLGLNAETNYSGLINGPGLIGATAATSRFYSRGDHAGNAFLPEELALVEQWITLEN